MGRPCGRPRVQTRPCLCVAGAKEIDIAATLEHLREQRPGMVQTKVLPRPLGPLGLSPQRGEEAAQLCPTHGRVPSWEGPSNVMEESGLTWLELPVPQIQGGTPGFYGKRSLLAPAPLWENLLDSTQSPVFPAPTPTALLCSLLDRGRRNVPGSPHTPT